MLAKVLKNIDALKDSEALFDSESNRVIFDDLAVLHTKADKMITKYSVAQMEDLLEDLVVINNLDENLPLEDTGGYRILLNILSELPSVNTNIILM